MFVLQNGPDAAAVTSAAMLEPVPPEGTAAAPVETKFDLALVMTETGAGIVTSWESSADLFDAGTVARLHAHFRCLLEEIARDADRRISRIPIVTPEER